MKRTGKFAVGSTLAMLSIAVAAQAVGVKQLYPGGTDWLNDPYTPGLSLLEKGGTVTYQNSWKNYPAFRGNPSRGVVGTIRIPVLLVDWSDFNPLTDDLAPQVDGVQTCPEYTPKTQAEISAMLNSATGAKGYFREVSGGKLNITFDVLPWIQSASSAYLKPRSAYLNYDAQGKFQWADSVGMARDALRAAIAEKNLNLLNYDADQNRVLDGLMVLYEGCSGKLGGSQMGWFNGSGSSSEPILYQHNAKDLVSATDPNKAKFDTQNILYNRFTLNATSGPFYTVASQVHELGHLLLGYADNYHFSPPVGGIYGSNGEWLLSANHGYPVPFHASALEKWLFGRWFTPTEAQQRNMAYALPDHQLSGDQVTAGFRQSSLSLLRIPVNGDPDHFLTVEFRHMAPPSQGGSAFNVQATGGAQIVTGVQVFEVDRRLDYFGYQQIRRVLPTRLQSTYAGASSQAWRPGDSHVYRDGSFGVQIQFYAENLSATNPRSSNATVVVTHLNAPTMVAPASVNATVGKPVSFTASATDPDLGDTQTWSMDYGPAGATFNPATRTFSWTPTSAQTVTASLRVTDSKGLFDQKVVWLTAK